MTDPLTIDQIRRNGMRLLGGTTLLMAVLTLGDALVGQGAAGLAIGGIAVVLAILPVLQALQKRVDGTARLIASVSALSMPALLLLAARGQPWQVDLHMIFFALLAMVAMLCDWRAIAAGTLVVAVHHLVLGMIVPDWVFGGQAASLGRILLHAAVLLAEAGALIWLTDRILTLLTMVDAGERRRHEIEAVVQAEREQQAGAVSAVVEALGDGLSAMAGGDLTCGVEAHFPPIYAALRTNFNDALTSLRGLIGTVIAGADAIRMGSGEIARASEDLAHRTEEGAATIEQTAASVAQIEARLRASVQAGARTVERADQAIATVGGGRAVAGEAVGAMGRVSESAKGIDSVIAGLDKIAFQTRVLAMNAAVEAGRAGDAGRGFAVVADLVSALAMRAEEEAKRARDQLTVTQSEIAVAVDAVHKVDGTFADISADVLQVHQLLATMAADNQAQSAAIGEVSAAIGGLDRATQQTAAMVEESSAAARNLTGEAATLADRAATFRISGRPGPSAAAPALTTQQRFAGPIRQLPAAAVAALTPPRRK